MALIKCRDCGKIISASAGACPFCGAPQGGRAAPANGSIARGCGALLLVGVAGLAGLLLLGALVPRSEEDKAHDLQIEACTAGEGFVKEKLRAPATAEFPSCGEISAEQNGDAWTISGYVDAQNGFGANIRSSWVVTALRGSQGRWFPTNVEILGQ